MSDRQNEKLGMLLCSKQIRLITAESCTAGMVAAALGDVEGCGEWLEGAFVTYTVAAKHAMLNIEKEAISRYGLTSEEIAREMANGALRNSEGRMAISNTGVAGPEDAPDGTRAGTVCFAWVYSALDGRIIRSATVHFQGDRKEVRRQAAHYSIAQAIALLESLS